MTDTAEETAAPKAATKRKATKKMITKRKKTSRKAPAGRLRVKQIKSTIQRKKSFKRTLTALGIKHHQDEIVVNDTPAIRGMLNQVRAFVHVTPEES